MNREKESWMTNQYWRLCVFRLMPWQSSPAGIYFWLRMTILCTLIVVNCVCVCVCVKEKGKIIFVLISNDHTTSKPAGGMQLWAAPSAVWHFSTLFVTPWKDSVTRGLVYQDGRGFHTKTLYTHKAGNMQMNKRILMYETVRARDSMHVLLVHHNLQWITAATWWATLPVWSLIPTLFVGFMSHEFIQVTLPQH